MNQLLKPMHIHTYLRPACAHAKCISLFETRCFEARTSLSARYRAQSAEEPAHTYRADIFYFLTTEQSNGHSTTGEVPPPTTTYLREFQPEI